jgi:peptidyl-prolyl cis-trans isomerase A (cyclophilin A)
MIKPLLLLPAAVCLLVLAAPAPAQVSAGKLPNGLYAVFSTSVGDITARLYEEEVPGTVGNFVELAQGVKPWRDPKSGAMVKRPLYSNNAFHRVLKGAMIQSGDPTGKGDHVCGITIPDEVLPTLSFDAPGKLAMANTGAPDTGGCQFFLTDAAVPEWDGNYTIFGTVVAGQEVITKIGNAPANEDKPIDPVKLISVTINRVGPTPPAKKPNN